MNNQNTITITQYLTFTLSDEAYALEINKVREVLDYTKITHVPRTPEFLTGVINLRGNVVPVVDMRLLLGMGKIERTVETCIIIVEILIEKKFLQIGAMADSVREVIDLDSNNIDAAPKMGTRLNTDFIKGMGKRNDAFIMLLDIDKVLNPGEVGVVHSASKMTLEGKPEKEIEKGKKELAKEMVETK